MRFASRNLRAHAGPGFTLVEMLVVIVIIALIFSMSIPRFAGRDRRTLQLAADQVADLLTMYAQRASLGQKPVGIWHGLLIED